MFVFDQRRIFNQ